MGKVILPLSEGELSEKTIFDRRFVIECCETFHLHWRNLRLELSADNWIQLVEAFETGIANGAPTGRRARIRTSSWRASSWTRARS